MNKKYYLEHQTLGRRFICPIGPATEREFILDWRILKPWCYQKGAFINYVDQILATYPSRVDISNTISICLHDQMWTF